MKIIQLTPQQRAEIYERRRQAGDRRIFQRLSAVLWIAEGRTREEVATLLGVSTRQVGQWLRIVRNRGLDQLSTLHSRGDSGRLRPAQVEALKEPIARGVFHNTQQVRDGIRDTFDIASTASGVKDRLHRIGASYHRVSGSFWKANSHSRQNAIRSTSSSVTASLVRSYNLVVRTDSCPAIAWAFS